MKIKKALLLAFAFALVLFAAGIPDTEAQGPPGTCCAVRFAQCAANCDCGVFEFNCTLDFPGCNSSCICNICP